MGEIWRDFDILALSFPRAARFRRPRERRGVCQRRAIIVEFIAAHRTNSALYAAYASSVFGHDYWVVVSESPNGSYDEIDAPRVVHVIELALERQRVGHEGGGARPADVARANAAKRQDVMEQQMVLPSAASAGVSAHSAPASSKLWALDLVRV